MGSVTTRDNGTAVDVTAVMPVRDGASTIGRQLDALAAQQPCCTWELVVADNGSIDRSLAIVRSHGIRDVVPVRVVDASRAPGVNVARNEGAAAGRGLLILLCDCDDVVDDKWLQRYWTRLGGGPASVAAGPADTSWVNPTRSTGWARALDSPGHLMPGCSFGWGANMGFHRTVWEMLGGFDESYQRGFDELDFFVRAFAAGVPFVWVGDARVHYRVPSNARPALARAFHFGRGNVRGRKRHADLGLSVPTFARTTVALAWGTLRIPFAARSATELRTQLRRIAFRSGILAELIADRGSMLRRAANHRPHASER